MPNRLKTLRIERDWTAEQAAQLFGLSRSGYVKLERGERRLSDKHIAIATRVFEVSPSEILGSTIAGGDELSGEIPTFAGFVQAGMFDQVDEGFQQDGFDVPEFVRRQPAYERARQYCYQVRGDSMNLAGIENGMWVVAADYADFIDKYGEVESGEFVIVERTRYQGSERELTIKEIRFYADRYELLPRSTNSEHKPIVVPHDHDVSGDAITVRIVGVLLTAYRDFRRK